jgi:hypothetical protein
MCASPQRSVWLLLHPIYMATVPSPSVAWPHQEQASRPMLPPASTPSQSLRRTLQSRPQSQGPRSILIPYDAEASNAVYVNPSANHRLASAGQFPLPEHRSRLIFTEGGLRV